VSTPTPAATPSPTPPPQPGKPKAPPATSPESLDTIIVTTKPHGWWALWAIAAAVTIALIWSVVATIPLQTSATGVVNGYQLKQIVAAPVAGIFELSTTKDDLNPETAAVSTGALLGQITPYNGGVPVELVSPVDGQISAVFISEGQGVEPGTEIFQITELPDRSKGMAITAWVPESTAYALTPGATADVTLTDVATSEAIVLPASIVAIGTVPSSVQSMTTVSGSSTLAQEWSDAAGGMPYRVDLALSLADWPADRPLPTPGAIVTLVNTYAELHPIQLLFGGV
jgi:multidrug efflux pump subunit AcrA (membrane-fusion protein)